MDEFIKTEKEICFQRLLQCDCEESQNVDCDHNERLNNADCDNHGTDIGEESDTEIDDEVHFQVLNGAKAPEKMSKGAVGWDLRFHTKEDVEIKAGETVVLSTGVKVKCPPGLFAKVESR